VKAVEIVDSNTISEIVKGLNCEISWRNFRRDDGFINPLAVMRGFAEKATANGANIQTETQVTQSKREADESSALNESRTNRSGKSGFVFGRLGRKFSENGGR
jgi:L-2-hydroxyglutarate oxidase LhgO